jgi:hypothetical protein
MSTPKLRSSDSGNQADATPVSDSDTTEANGKKKYSRDFLLTLSQHCTDLPVGFQMSDAASALINSLAGKSYVLDREPHLEQLESLVEEVYCFLFQKVIRSIFCIILLQKSEEKIRIF